MINLKSIMCLVGLAVSTNAFCEELEPTTLKVGNLKGNVLSVMSATYEYKENFGDPIAGKMRGFPVTTFYDEQGRSIVTRTIADGSYNVSSYSYLFKYEEGGKKLTKYVLNSLTKEGTGSSLNEAFQTANSSFESLMGTLPPYSSGIYLYHLGEYEYDGNVLVSYTLKDGKHANYKILGKYVAKKQDNGSYNWTYYKSDGSSVDNGVITYNKWGIASRTSASEGSFAPKIEFKMPEPGTYTYDVKGVLTDHVLKAEARKYTYNDKGDVTKMSKKPFTTWVDGYCYENYVYDDHGNWISRTRGTHPGEPNVIEKRVIVYADSKEDLAQKSAALIQAIEPIVEKLK